MVGVGHTVAIVKEQAVAREWSLPLQHPVEVAAHLVAELAHLERHDGHDCAVLLG